jgi:hypothetical protein
MFSVDSFVIYFFMLQSRISYVENVVFGCFNGTLVLINYIVTIVAVRSKRTVMHASDGSCYRRTSGH